MRHQLRPALDTRTSNATLKPAVSRTDFRPFVALVLLTAALAVSGCSPKPGAQIPAARGAPVVLLSVDTLRSDHLSLYSPSGVETPAIERLARDGVVFDHAFSHVPLTLPSHLSLLSGELPGDHGVRDNLGYRFRADDHPWLPRALKRAGYRTGGFVSAYVLRSETGIEADFDRFDSTIEVRQAGGLAASQRSCEETLAPAKAWVEQVAAVPFFLFVHFYEPHSPYEPPADLAQRFADPYDGEIAAADRCVGELLGELDRLGLYDKSLIYFLSDHGEGLGDHGEKEHGLLLYRESLQVPVVVKLPGAQLGGTRRGDAIGLFDLAPTTRMLLGLPAAERTDGVALFPAPQGAPRALFSESFYPRLHYGWSDLASVIEFPSHLIEGPDPELYDLANDAAERRNLRDDQRRKFVALRETAKSLASPLTAPSAEDAETTAKLAALGYIGSAAQVEGPLPDPKTKLDSLRDYALALLANQNRDYVRAVELYSKLTRENPAMIDAWEGLGLALHRLGRLTEARQAYEKAMQLSRGVSHVAVALARLLLDMGKPVEAREHAELALQVSPVEAHAVLAEVALDRKDLAAAEREAEAAVNARGTRIGPLLTLARVRRDQGRLEQALALTDQAASELEKSADEKVVPGLFFVRADLFARFGRVDDAVTAFRREIEVSPTDTRPYTHLAALYAALGEMSQARRALDELVKANPDAPIAWSEAVRTLRVIGDPASARRVLAEARRKFPREPEILAL